MPVVFNPVSIPPEEGAEFELYGKEDLKTPGNHFFKEEENNAKRAKLAAEWSNFKYELADWAKEYLAIPSSSVKLTPTEWALRRFLRQKTSYSRSYPLLLLLGEVCLSMPVSNAWPERGASAVKRLKTCLRNSQKKDMLESLLHTTINGPPVERAEALINTAVAMWKDKKKLRKLSSSHLESFSTENLEQDHHEIAEELKIPMMDLINFKEGQDEQPRGCEEIVVELE